MLWYQKAFDVLLKVLGERIFFFLKLRRYFSITAVAMQTQSVYSPIQAKSCYVKNEDLLSFRLHFDSNNMHRAVV